jgi:hypothetical protein
VPVFIVTWHIVALIPTGIHLFLSRSGFMAKASASSPLQRGGNDQGVGTADAADVLHNQEQRSAIIDQGNCEDNVVSSVEGASEHWPVQMAWGIYYIAGTLFFTSIMAVTVWELTLWVVVGLVTTGCSKVLALFLCLVCEHTDGTMNSGG